MLAMFAALSAAYAQLPINPGSSGSSQSSSDLGGTATIDLIVLREGMLGVPLRYGGVLPGTERVEFNGRSLQRGVEYQIDADSGVVYLMRSFRSGDSLRVGYRYNAERALKAAQSNQFSGVAPFRFDLSPGSRLLVGFGMTERQADGNVVQTNIYGWNNKLKFGSTSMSGLFLLGNRQKVDSGSDYEFRARQETRDLGKSHFALQNMAVALGGGGELDLNYQDISQNFAGFGAATDAGFGAAQIQQLQKERGLKRFALGLNQADFGGVKLSGNFRTVEDNGEDISWQSLGLSSGGLALNWKSQKVGDSFRRFQDLAEGDREQLRKEVGMERETLAGSFAQKAGKLSFSMSQITDPNSAKIDRREVNFDSDKFKFSYGDQEVEQGFARMGALKGDEQALWGREVGMSRQWFGLQTSLFGPGHPLTFSQNILSSANGEYFASNWKYQGTGWSLEQVNRSASDGFSSYQAMQDGERNENINSIGRMYDPNGVPFRGEEAQWFQRSAGIDRGLTRFNAQMFKDMKLNIDHLQILGQNDGATVDTLSLDGKKFKIGFRRQELGDQFQELTQLLELERNRLGVISGLERTDFNVNVQMSPSRSFLYSSMKADSPNGGASREQFAYADPKLQISMNSREVDPNFANVGMLVDPEKEFLAAMRGFQQRDIKAAWQISPNLKFDAYILDSGSESLDQTRYIRNYQLAYKPDKLSNIVARRFEERNDDPMTLLFANATEFLSLSRDFGRFGKLSVLMEDKDYEGQNSVFVDSEKRYYGYEARINPTTSVKTEQTTTTYESGSKEAISANTVSTDLGKHMGVSVTQLAIDRDGGDRDEKKRGYGFWFDIANGIRLAYGYAQHKAGETALDTENQNLNVTGGTAGNVQVGNGGYTENQWEGGRTQALGNFSLATVKPMKFFGLTDLKLQASMDTSADRAVFLKENQLFSMSGKISGNGIGYDYRSQVAPNGLRGIDRSVFFTTDQDEKKPIRLNMKYKQRNLPTGEEILIRDYSIVAKPLKSFELSHHLITNPEVARGDVILGSLTQARKENRWKLDYNKSPGLQLGGEWREFSDQGHPRTRLGGVNLTLNKNTGSPLGLFYGVEESDAGGVRKRTDRYHIRFDQRPGPHQQFSFFVGNVSYLRGMTEGLNKNNMTIQLDFQIKF
jgi:hypothetical protein